MLTTFTRTDHVCILGVMVGAVVVVVVVVVVEIVVGVDDVVAPILVRTWYIKVVKQGQRPIDAIAVGCNGWL